MRCFRWRFKLTRCTGFGEEWPWTGPSCLLRNLRYSDEHPRWCSIWSRSLRWPSGSKGSKKEAFAFKLKNFYTTIINVLIITSSPPLSLTKHFPIFIEIYNTVFYHPSFDLLYHSFDWERGPHKKSPEPKSRTNTFLIVVPSSSFHPVLLLSVVFVD